MENDYLLDGQEISFIELINFAQKQGFQSPDGLFFVSAAADFLRKLGHTVENNPARAVLT